MIKEEQERRVIENALDVVKTLGRRVSATKLIRTYNDEGILVDVKKANVVVERQMDESYTYGLKIAFLEDTDFCAIWYNGRIVFCNLGDRLDKTNYQNAAMFLDETVDEDTGKSDADTYIPGEWEEVLAKLAEKASTIKEERAEQRILREELEHEIKVFNDRMLKFLPFKYTRCQIGWPSLRAYKDKLVYVDSEAEEQDELRVYWLGDGGKKKVFDFRTRLFEPGRWREHIEDILYREMKKSAKDAARHGYNPETLEPAKPFLEEADEIKKLVESNNPEKNFPIKKSSLIDEVEKILKGGE